MRKDQKDVPGSSRRGGIDTRSSDANARQADEVKPHAERAGEKPAETSPGRGEVGGNLKDQVGH